MRGAGAPQLPRTMSAQNFPPTKTITFVNKCLLAPTDILAESFSPTEKLKLSFNFNLKCFGGQCSLGLTGLHAK